MKTNSLIKAMMSSVVISLTLSSAAMSESKLHTINFKKSTTPLDSSKAREMIQKYYNSHGSWAGIYSMQKITGIRLKHINNHRVEAHVEYRYKANSSTNIKPASGVDNRTFVLIRHRHWSVIGMGKHKSGSLK